MLTPCFSVYLASFEVTARDRLFTEAWLFPERLSAVTGKLSHNNAEPVSTLVTQDENWDEGFTT